MGILRPFKCEWPHFLWIRRCANYTYAVASCVKNRVWVTLLMTGSTLNCPSECEVACIGPCVPDCCVAAPRYSGIYSSVMSPMQPASTGYQCHFPCPNACSPACSTKCCQAFYRVSTLFFRRKRAWGRMTKQPLQKYLYRILRTQMRHRRRN